MRPTREGKRFLLSLVLIALAALNTGNNLMYLILAMMLAVLAISFLMLKINLSGLSLSVSLDQPVYARQEAEMVLTLTNAKRFISSYSLKIVLPKGMHGEGYFTSVPLNSSSKVTAEVRVQRWGVYT